MRTTNGEACDTSKGSQFASILDVLRWHATHEGKSAAFTFLHDDGSLDVCTYGELAGRAQRIAAELRKATSPQDRALLLFPSGLEFIAAFYGCLAAGVIAVPAYPPDPARFQSTAKRLAAIAHDCEAAVVLTTHGWLSLASASGFLPDSLARIPWLATDDSASRCTCEDFDAVEWDPDAVAVLQYTSGSTGDPRGVMLSQRQLMASQKMTCQACQSSRDDIIVGWVPLYHDLGLSGHVLHPVYVGAHAILMSPVSFVQKPFRWLKAISDFQGTMSGGPNFAFELCARKSTPQERAMLDLSSWRVAPNGAEPVIATTIERFASTFAECGFRASTMMPVYGLAEATLGVSARQAGKALAVSHYDRAALQKGFVSRTKSSNCVSLVGCGPAIGEGRIEIVDPNTRERCAADRIGEIWVNSPSVALGYWNRPEETAATFRAKLLGESHNYLRTGDLGFVENGELFITGRLKDLVIVDGKNHSAEDIELTAQQSHPALRPGGAAAFQHLPSGAVASQFRTVLVAELRRGNSQAPVTEIASAILSQVSREHGLGIDDVVLIEAGTLPKTSSGKIQRSATRAAYEAGALSIVGSWSRGRAASSNCLGNGARKSVTEIEAWLRNEIGRLVDLPPIDVDLAIPIKAYGLSSKEALLVSADLGAFLGFGLPPGFLFEAESLDATISRLADPDCERKLQSVGEVRWQPWR